jgi:hypothetical protein
VKEISMRHRNPRMLEILNGFLSCSPLAALALTMLVPLVFML